MARKKDSLRKGQEEHEERRSPERTKSPAKESSDEDDLVQEVLVADGFIGNVAEVESAKRLRSETERNQSGSKKTKENVPKKIARTEAYDRQMDLLGQGDSNYYPARFRGRAQGWLILTGSDKLTDCARLDYRFFVEHKIGTATALFNRVFALRSGQAFSADQFEDLLETQDPKLMLGYVSVPSQQPQPIVPQSTGRVQPARLVKTVANQVVGCKKCASAKKDFLGFCSDCVVQIRIKTATVLSALGDGLKIYKEFFETSPLNNWQIQHPNTYEATLISLQLPIHENIAKLRFNYGLRKEGFIEESSLCPDCVNPKMLKFHQAFGQAILQHCNELPGNLYCITEEAFPRKGTNDNRNNQQTQRLNSVLQSAVWK